MKEAFQLTFSVIERHIDELNHVNNVVYLEWVQQAAAAHWNFKAPASMRSQFNWVVLRHEIDYKSPATLGDEIVATTWVHNYEGLRSTRIVQFTRKSDSRLLAEARTTWCLLNSLSNKPVRIPLEIQQLFRAEEAEPIG